MDDARIFEHKPAPGVRLHVREWLPRENCEGVLLLHGLGEHCGRYTHLIRFFRECGLAVRIYDQRGHGRSSGTRGDIPDPDALLRDAKSVLSDFMSRLSSPPLLFGHSMGGLIAARLASGHVLPLRGLMLSSPALSLELSDWQQTLLGLLHRFAPGFAVGSGLKTQFLSHDRKVIDAYRRDPFVHSKISARFLRMMLDTMEYVHDHATTIKIPCLVQVAEDDKLVDPTGSERFVARVPEAFVTSHFYPGFYHEIFNEIDAGQVFTDLRSWMEQKHFAPHRA